jgi:hypothetical protein
VAAFLKMTRVTRLGEFSHIGFLRAFFKTTEVAQICGLLASTEKVMY